MNDEANQANGGIRSDNGVNENGHSSTTSSIVFKTFKERLRHGFQNRTLPAYDMKVFVKNGRALPFHKILFVSASSYFLDLFEKGTPQNNGERSVKVQMDLDVCKVIKMLLYTDTFPNEMTIDVALRALESSIQYGIEILTPRMVDEVVRIMSPTAALNVLTTARSYELKKLEIAALELIYRNAEEVLQHEDFPKLGLFDVQNVLTSDSLNCKESVVFHAALRWASNKSMNQKPAFKYYFRKVVHFVRFPLMTTMELAELVNSYKDAMDVISPNELVDVFVQISLPVYKRTNNLSLFSSAQRNCDDIKCRREEVGTQTEPTVNDKQLPPRSLDPGIGVLSGDRLSMPPPLSPAPVSLSKKRSYADSEVSFASTVTTPGSVVRGKKAARMAEAEEADSDDDFLLLATAKIENKLFCIYEDMFRRYRERDNSDLDGFKITNNDIANNYRSIVLNNCSDVVIDIKLSFLEGKGIKTFLQFIKDMDLMRYLVINKVSPNPLIVENLWPFKQNILLILSGVTFLKISHAENELVLNYIKESHQLLTNEEMKLTKLAVSNSEFSLKMLKNQGKLEELILYRVWGEFMLEEFINDCPKLSKLVCWKYVPTPWLTGCQACIPPCLIISNNFLTKTSLKKLVLYRTQLKCVGTRVIAGTNIEELFLDRCYTKTNTERAAPVLENFSKIFPRLKKLMIVEDLFQGKECDGGNIATSELLNMVRKEIVSIEWVRIVGLKWSASTSPADSRNSVYFENEDANLNDFLKGLNLPDKSHNFLLEKAETWKGTDHQELEKESLTIDGGYWSSLDEMEYNWYELKNFYKNCEVYEEFFVQDDERMKGSRKKGSKARQDTFPRPLLWY